MPLGSTVKSPSDYMLEDLGSVLLEGIENSDVITGVQDAIKNKDYKLLLTFLELYLSGGQKVRGFDDQDSPYNRFISTVKRLKWEVNILLDK